jgi:luciferase family oxidoreductase group 1
MPFSFAHHFAARNTEAAVAGYRAAFRPSAELTAPYVMLGVTVICADTDERAEWLSGSGRLSFVRLRTGRAGRLPSPEEAAAHQYTPLEKETARTWTGSQIIGSPERVRKQLLELADRTGADELMITTMVHSHAERLHSYELVADVMELAPRS